MVLVWWILILSWTCAVQLVNARDDFARGNCVLYTSSGNGTGFCDEVLQGRQYMLGEALDFASVEAGLSLYAEEILENIPDSSECGAALKKALCLANFMPCDIASQEPRKLCKSSCKQLSNHYCPGIGAWNESMSVLDCDGTVEGNDLLYLHYPRDLGPTFAFAHDKETIYRSHDHLSVCIDLDQDLENITLYEERFVCPEPFLTRHYPALKQYGEVGFSTPDDSSYCSTLDKNNMHDPARCFVACELPCPYGYTLPQYYGLWIAEWLPGVISIPFNIAIIRTESRRIRRRKKRFALTRWRFVLQSYMIHDAGIISLGIALIGSVPSLILGPGIRCAGYDTYSFYTNVDGSPYCKFGLLREDLTLALLCFLLTMLYFTFSQVSAMQHGKALSAPRRRASIMSKVRTYALPVLLAIATLCLQGDALYGASVAYRVRHGGGIEGTSEYTLHTLRYQFACGSYFREKWQENLLVNAPILVVSFLVFWFCGQILQRIYHLHGSLKVSAGSTAVAFRALNRVAGSGLRLAMFMVPLLVLHSLEVFLIYKTSPMEDIAMAVAYRNACDKYLANSSSVDFTTYETAWTTKIIADSSFKPASFCTEVVNSFPAYSNLVLLTLTRSLPALIFAFSFKTSLKSMLKSFCKKKHHLMGANPLTRRRWKQSLSTSTSSRIHPTSLTSEDNINEPVRPMAKHNARNSHSID